jgi:iron complex transport system substrate-binding protein
MSGGMESAAVPTKPARLTRRAGLAAGAALGLAGAAAPPPRRVVSTNPCLDVILVRVADRSQLTALSRYARDPQGSTIADIAATVPVVQGSAEEVAALRPDVVLISTYTAASTRTALNRMGFRVAAFGLPSTVAESLAQVTDIAALVGRPERGARVAARIRAALAGMAPAPGTPRLSALVFQPGGFASAEGTLMDEMLRRAGFANAASRYGLKQSANVPLERLIADPPDVLLAGAPYPGAPTWAERVVRHPALARVSTRMHRAAFPERLLYCGGPVLIDTAAALVRAREQALGRT